MQHRVWRFGRSIVHSEKAHEDFRRRSAAGWCGPVVRWVRHHDDGEMAVSAPFVIVIGTGEGGLAVMRRALAGLSDDFGGAIVLLMHSSADDADPLPQLRQGTGRVHVSMAEDGSAVTPGHVHVVPRGCHAVVESPGVLRIAGPKPGRTTRPAIDELFRSAAAVYQARTVGLVLTGRGDDGTEGLRAIGAVGGLGMVQSVVDSECSEMPMSALIGDHPYKSLLIQGIAPALLGVAGSLGH